MTDLDSLIFNIDIECGQPRCGSLLVAEPFLKERYFDHGVICLVDYQPREKPMGVVLNKPTAYTLDQLIDSVGSEIPVFCGGPVSNDRLYFMHRLGKLIPGGSEIAPGLYLGGDFDAMIDYINSGYRVDGFARFFIGYSGWDLGQLESELSQKVWAVTSITDTGKTLVGSDDAYWHRTVRSMGPAYRGWLYHPQDLRAN